MAVDNLSLQLLDRFNAADGYGTAINGGVVAFTLVDAGGDHDVILLHSLKPTHCLAPLGF